MVARSTSSYSWSDIEVKLTDLKAVAGGFSPAKRGLLTLPDGRNIFVKIGVDTQSRAAAQREIKVYDYLVSNTFPYIPQPLLTNGNDTGFALEALTPEQGWDWHDDWTKERLDETLEALDALAALKPQGPAKIFFGEQQLGSKNEGWQILATDQTLQKILLQKLHSSGKPALARKLNFTAEADISKRFAFANNTLVHYDIRADNCAWHPKTRELKIIDWNWTCLGDRRIDLAAMLTHVHKSGFDILPDYWTRLDASALQWLAGFWLKAAATSIWPDGPAHLRDMQLGAGIAALELRDRL